MLKGKGYTILAHNYLVRGGELDLVAWHGGLLVFVEVKTRNSRGFGGPAEAVDLKKRRRMEKAAKVFLARYRDRQPRCRFDLEEVERAGPGSARIRQVEDAFRPGWEAE